jgi:lipoprotein-anchoring transpeptidase ErfK/SrfK
MRSISLSLRVERFSALKWVFVFLVALLGLRSAEAHPSRVIADVVLSEQRLYLTVDGSRAAVWPVSTARRGYRTPVGSYRPRRLQAVWYSRRYDWAPMPHAIFFRGGYAIHGTYEVRSLGRPVSHGCIRLAPAAAAMLFSLVRSVGPGATLIRVRP